MTQQDMMRPKSALFYSEKIGKVAEDCLDHMEKRLDKNGIYPGNERILYFYNLVNFGYIT